MKADKAATVFQTAGSTQQPLFGAQLQPAFYFTPIPAGLFIFFDNNCLLYTQTGAELDFWLEQLYQANKMAPVGCKMSPRLHYFARTNHNPPEGL